MFPERRVAVLPRAAGNLHTSGHWCFPKGALLSCPGRLAICTSHGQCHRRATEIAPLAAHLDVDEKSSEIPAAKALLVDLPSLAISSLSMLCTTGRKPLRQSRRERRADVGGIPPVMVLVLFPRRPRSSGAPAEPDQGGPCPCRPGPGLDALECARTAAGRGRWP